MTPVVSRARAILAAIASALGGRRGWLLAASAVIVAQGAFTAVIRLYVVPVLTPGSHWQHGLQNASDSMFFHEEAVAIAAQLREQGWAAFANETYEGLAHTKLIAAVYYVVGADSPGWVFAVNALLAALSAVLLVAILKRIGVDRAWAALVTIVLCMGPLFLFLHSELLREALVIPSLLAISLGTLLLGEPATPRFLSWRGAGPFLGGALLIAIGTTVATEFRPYLILPLLVGLAVVATAVTLLPFVITTHRRAGAYQVVAIWLVVLFSSQLGPSPDRVQPYRTQGVDPVQSQAQEIENQQAREQLRQKIEAQPAVTETPDADAVPLTHEDYFISYVCDVNWQPTSWIPAALEAKFESLACARDGYLYFCDPELMANRADRNCDDREFSSAVDVIGHLPRAVAFGLFVPFPNMWFDGFGSGGTGLRRAGYIVDGAVAYALLPGLFLLIWTKGREHPHYLACVLGLIAVLTIYSMAVPGQFILARMRLGFYLALLAFGAAGWIQWIGGSAHDQRAAESAPGGPTA